MHLYDFMALGVFAICWLAYEPILKRLSGGHGGINADMAMIRDAWVQQMLKRDIRLFDANLLGHLLNSASFFASSNLLVIAASIGVIFSGADWESSLASLPFAKPVAPWLVELKIGLVVIALARGLLDFVWAIRQLNYCVALFGAAPSAGEADVAAFREATRNVLNPALSAFNCGVRSYYFALAAAAWLVGPWAMIGAAVWAVALLAWRQTSSQAAHGVRLARDALDRE
jgi:uncharacterized membrane protein